MNRDVFVQRIDSYLASVRENALKLFDDGVLAENALSIAEQIANSQEMKRAHARAQLAGIPRGASPILHG